jgi:hypothetical protein
VALTDCRSCGNQVAKSAKTCPHCGVSSPGGWIAYQGVGGEGCLKALGCLVLVGALLWMFGACPALLMI